MNPTGINAYWLKDRILSKKYLVIIKAYDWTIRKISTMNQKGSL
jgi:hypothetical protein